MKKKVTVLKEIEVSTTCDVNGEYETSYNWVVKGFYPIDDRYGFGRKLVKGEFKTEKKAWKYAKKYAKKHRCEVVKKTDAN